MGQTSSARELLLGQDKSYFQSSAVRYHKWTTFTVKQSLEGIEYDAFPVLTVLYCAVLYCTVMYSNVLRQWLHHLFYVAVRCVAFESYNRSGSPVPLLGSQIARKRSFELRAIFQMTELFE